MKTRIVRIGNSQGMRIPKRILEQTGLENEVEMRVRGNRLMIMAVTGARRNWAKAFEEMAKRGDDVLADSRAPDLTAAGKGD
jgi:antitoxin MazE